MFTFSVSNRVFLTNLALWEFCFTSSIMAWLLYTSPSVKRKICKNNWLINLFTSATLHALLLVRNSLSLRLNLNDLNFISLQCQHFSVICQNKYNFQLCSSVLAVFQYSLTKIGPLVNHYRNVRLVKWHQSWLASPQIAGCNNPKQYSFQILDSTKVIEITLDSC